MFRVSMMMIVSSRNHCQRSPHHRESPSRISDMPRAGFEPAQNLSSGLVERSCAVVITTTQRRHSKRGKSFQSKRRLKKIKN